MASPADLARKPQQASPYQRQQDQPPLKSPHQISHYRRDILTTTIKAHERAQETQDELERQGAKLKDSLKDAKQVAGRTVLVNRDADTLIKTTQEGCLRRMLRCCCPRCCGPDRSQPTQAQLDATVKKDLQRNLRSPKAPSSPDDGFDSDVTDVETDEYNSYIRMDKLEKLVTQRGSQAWKRTLAPRPYGGGGRLRASDKDLDVWYNQMDISLTQLQRLAEDMGESLEEQLRLAQLLTIYLNYGADQVISVNDKLTVAQNVVKK